MKGTINANNSQYDRLKKNIVFIFFGNVGSKLITFFLAPFFTFWLSEEDFGVQDIMLVYSVLIIPYVTMGLYEAVFVFPKDKTEREQGEYLTLTTVTTLFMLVVLGLLLVILPTKIISIIFPDKLYNYIFILYILIALESFQRIFQCFTRGIDKIKIFSLIGIIYSIIMLLMSIIFVPRFGLNGYWFSLLMADFFSISYTVLAIRAWKYFRFNIDFKQKFREMILFSIPLIPNATMWWIINSINRPILISSVGLDGVGLYSVAGKFPSILGVVFSIFYSAFQISALEEHKKENFRDFYTNIFRLILLIQFIITVGFELFGQYLFKWFIDDKFVSAEFYLPVLSLGIVFSNIAIFVGIMFTVKRKTIHFLYSSLLGAFVAIGTNLWLIPEMGIMGACVAIILSQFSMIAYRYYKSMVYVSLNNIKLIAVEMLLLVLSVCLYYISPNSIFKYITILLCLLAMIILNKNIIIATLKGGILKSRIRA